MRIGMFVDMYKPYLSGVTNHVSLYKRRFEDLGHEVFVFTFGNLGHADDEPRIIRSPGVRVPGTGAQVGLAFSPHARAIIRTLDIAHVHHPFLSGRLVLAAARSLDLPVVFTNHSRYDLYSDAYAGFLPRSLRYGYLRRYLGRFCEACNLVVVPSAGIERWLAEFGVTGSLALLPNAVDTAPFRSPANPMSKADFGFPEDSVVLAYVGRLSAEKNIATLVEAFVGAAMLEPSLRLLLVGDGNAAEDARTALSGAGLSDRVRFAGTVPYELIPDYCAAGDVFVTASVSEVHPLVVIEAMAAGLPVLGVESPGVSDTVEDGETGLLVAHDANTASNLAERMLWLARDDGLCSSLGTRAAQVAAETYDIGAAAEAMLVHYERLIAERAAARHG